MRRRLLAVVCLAALAAVWPGSFAHADGDPGSDVLVYQSLFLEADAGVSLSQQAHLAALLAQARRAGFPIRVAIVASRYDLGAVTELWRKPRSYARFLGLELSQAYTGRLLVAMPNGFGFNWPGHSASAAYETLSHITIGPGGSGMADAAQSAVRSLAAAGGVRLTAAIQPSTGSAPAQSASQGGTRAAGGSSVDSVVAIVVAALGAAIALSLLARRVRRRPNGLAVRLPRPRRSAALASALAVALGGALLAVVLTRPAATAHGEALAANPSLDPGTPISGLAPNFTLTDQFGHSESLRSFRGKVVLLAFNDSECTTICPLTTAAMLDAKAMLGSAASRLQLLGVDANPKATSLEDVLSYSQVHGMLHAWHFLTGPISQLRRVWSAYHIEAAVQGGEIAHTPALFVIDPLGNLAKVYVTQQSYAAVGQLGQLLAHEASRLLPGHPAVDSHLSYSRVAGISPGATAVLPGAGGGTVSLGPGHARVFVFFATWDRQITGLAAGLESLGGYAAVARRAGLPPLTAVDEGSVEPLGALGRFLATLPHPLGYPVAVDRTGRVADGYQVEGLPWLMVVSGSGRIAWYYSVAALGWPTTAHLVADVRDALARVANAPTSLHAALAGLEGSPPPLAALHRQAGQLLGGESALAARIRGLRGYPIVINFWASWCGPCRSEFGLFADASARYGRRVAFLGADTGDSFGDARAFLAQHPVSYPSYQTSTSGIDWLVPQGLAGLPTTAFISPAGKLVYVHTGQYDSQGTLDGDIESYARGR